MKEHTNGCISGVSCPGERAVLPGRMEGQPRKLLHIRGDDQLRLLDLDNVWVGRVERKARTLGVGIPIGEFLVVCSVRDQGDGEDFLEVGLIRVAHCTEST